MEGKIYQCQIIIPSIRTIQVKAKNIKHAKYIVNNLDGIGDNQIINDIGEAFLDIDHIGKVKEVKTDN